MTANKQAQAKNTAWIVIIVLIILLIIGIVTFANVKKASREAVGAQPETTQPRETQPPAPPAEGEGEYVNLQTADDDFAALDESMDALG